MTPMDINVQNDTLYAIAAIVIIVVGIVWLLGYVSGWWRRP